MTFEIRRKTLLENLRKDLTPIGPGINNFRNSTVREKSPMTKHITNSFLYKNMAEKHQEKIESFKILTKTKKKIKIINKIENSLHIRGLSSDMDNLFLSEIKTKFSPARNIRSSYQLKSKQKKLNQTDDPRNSKYRNYITDKIRIPTLENVEVNNIMLGNYNHNSHRSHSFITPVKIKNKKKLEEYQRTAKLLKRREDEEFLEKISLPVNEKFLNRTANNFNKNKGLYKIHSGARLKSAIEVNNFQSFDELQIISNEQLDNNNISNGMQVSLENLLIKESENTNYPFIDPANPLNNHFFRMMKISANYKKIRSPNQVKNMVSLNNLITKNKEKSPSKYRRILSEIKSFDKLIDDFSIKEEHEPEIEMHVKSLLTNDSFLNEDDKQNDKINVINYKNFIIKNKGLFSPNFRNKQSEISSSTTKAFSKGPSSGLPNSSKSFASKNNEISTREIPKFETTTEYKFNMFMKKKKASQKIYHTKLVKNH